MKAVLFEQHGESDVLTFGDFRDPQPGSDEVLVDIRACSLNHLDIWVRKGLPGIAIPMPHVPGSDLCGVISECGSGVKDFKKGDRVIANPGMGCGTCARCRDGWDSLCDSYNILGLQLNGGYAERIAVPARRVIKVSTRYAFEEWAATPLVFLTAWHMLETHAKIESKDRVLIHAAGSGVGSAAIQIARLKGCEVFTTVGRSEKEERARKLGAHHVINYRRADFGEEVRRLTSQQGVDVIFEHIGPDTWQKNLSCLAKAGRLVTCGATSGGRVETDLRFLFMRQQTIMGSYMGGQEELIRVLKLLERGELKPVVDKVYRLPEAAKAHDYMESRANFGKIVLTI